MKERKRNVFGVRRVLSAFFAVSFVVALLSTISAFAGANLFKIQNAELGDLSTGVTGTISTFDETNIESNVTFHKLDDIAKYTITLKNTDNKDHIIQLITDDNDNPYVSYEYNSYANTLVKAGDSIDFVVTAKYANAVTDKNARAQATNVKFFLKFTDIDEPEAISVNPKTGDNIMTSVVVLAISAAGLIACALIAIKCNKKHAKVFVAAIVAVSAVVATASVHAAKVETNSISITSNYGLYDKVAITWTDANGNEHEEFVPYNEPANIPDQTKPGHTFTGWEDENGNPVDLTEPITDDLNIHPTFRAHTYTVKFNGNGATGSMDSVEMTYGETKTLPASAFSFLGRTYAGWDTEANGSGTHYNDQAEVKNLTTEDNGIVTLYAQWSINPFFINYDGNGATSGEMATTNCEYDQSCILRENAFKKTGHHFIGWKYNNNDYTNKADVTNIIESGTITMVAQWAVNHYTIVFNINTDDANASGTMADMANLEYGTEYSLTANAFTRTGYNFDGWSTEVDGHSYSLTDAQLFRNLTTVDNDIVTLYAQWAPIHYNIVFHQNHDGVAGSTNSIMNVAYDETRVLSQNGFALEHYKYMGWNTATDGTGTPYEDGASIKNLTTTDGATIDLYAQWKERTAMLQTGPNVKNALSNLNNTATTFKRYDGASAPDLDSISDKVDIALPTSSFPVWAWSEGDNVYWWSEAEAPKFNPTSNNFFNGLSFTSIDVSGLDASSATGMNGMFANLKLTSLNLSGFDSSAAKNMGSMFSGTTISSLDLSSLNTSSATTMGSMFYKAKIDSLKLYDETNPSESLFKTDNVTEMAGMFRESNIPSIDASKFNTAKVKDFSCMFMSASATTIDVSGWNTESATDFTNTFANVKLTSLDLSHFNTKKVKSMLGMFDGTVKMESLNVSGWDNESLTTVGYMFRSCGKNVTNGATVNLAGFTTPKVKSMNLMFSGSGFTSLNLGSFSSAELTDMSNMFSQMGKIQSLSFGPDFTAEHVTNMYYAFAQMGGSMVNLDLSSLNVSSVTNLNGAFASNTAATIDLTGWDFSNVESANNTFYGANYITTIYASSDFPASLGGTSFAYGQPIKGGAGTTYIGNENTYARIDDPDNGNPGYFTEKNARYIRYDGNGADNAEYETMTSHYLTNTGSLKANAFVRDGYAFDGWNTAADGSGASYTDKQVMSELTESKTPLTLYAMWYQDKDFNGTVSLTQQYSTADVLQLSATMPQGYVGAAYFNPANLKERCNATSTNVADKEAKNGCMKWYIYGDDGTNYKMLLDHNTTARISFNSSNNNSNPQALLNQLSTDTADWDTNNLTVDIFTANEVAAIAGINPFNVSGNTASTGKYYPLDTYEINSTDGRGRSAHAWMYDYTQDCETHGCDYEMNKGYGYWTKTALGGSKKEAWLINYLGRLTITEVKNANWGIRPTVTISKSLVNAE